MVDPKNIPMERSRDCVEIDFLHINIQKKISLFRLFASSQEPKRQLFSRPESSIIFHQILLCPL